MFILKYSIHMQMTYTDYFLFFIRTVNMHKCLSSIRLLTDFKVCMCAYALYVYILI